MEMVYSSYDRGCWRAQCQNCKYCGIGGHYSYCGIGGHNVRTCAKKKADTEVGGYSQKNKEITDEEVIDPEETAHEAYPLVAPPQTSLQPTLAQSQDALPQTPLQHTQAHLQEAPPQTPPHPTIQAEAPMKPRKKENASKSQSTSGQNSNYPAKDEESKRQKHFVSRWLEER
ncbi:hypothetical protein LIER_25149 [Lithospermum erythrorhizon]|uniref:Gag-pol polyprotein n=1 Tax=Lithospermum erythrorhizon TaxID=34254 RepID=A0AAV3R581_LITER